MKIFLKSDREDIPTLYWDMILVESTKPVLFTCRDKEDNRYICARCRADAERCEWIIVPTTCERLIDLLNSKVSIRQIFDGYEAHGFLAERRAGEAQMYAYPVSMEDIPPELLPTAGYTMDADPGEFNEEIALLQKASEVRFAWEDITYSFTNFDKISTQFRISLVSSIDNSYRKSRKMKSVRAIGA